MLEEGIDDVDDVVGEVGMAARPVRQQRGQGRLRQLRGEAGGAGEDGVLAAAQFRHGQDLRRAEVDADEVGHVAQHLAIGPGLAAGDDGHLAEAEALQLGIGAVVDQHVAGQEGDAAAGEEFLGAQAARAAGHPVDADLVVEGGGHRCSSGAAFAGSLYRWAGSASGVWGFPGRRFRGSCRLRKLPEETQPWTAEPS